MSLLNHHFNNNQNNNNIVTSSGSLSFSASSNIRVRYHSFSSLNKQILSKFRNVPILVNSNDVHRMLDGKFPHLPYSDTSNSIHSIS